MVLAIEKILEDGIKIHQKSEEMVPRSAPKAILEGESVLKRLQGGTNTTFLEAFWRHLGDCSRRATADTF